MASTAKGPGDVYWGVSTTRRLWTDEVSVDADDSGPDVLDVPASPPRTGTSIEASFSEWVGSHQRSLLSFARLISGDAHAAEDLVQVALAKAYLKWGKLSGEDHSPLAYVRRVIVNENATLWRRPWRRQEQLTGTPPERAAVGEEALDTTWALVQALPLRQRTVVALRFYADLSVIDTALAMGCSTGTVKTHTSRAMATLKERLDHVREGSDDA